MLKAFIVFTCFAGAFASLTTRIVNGTDAKEGEIPYIVSIRYYGFHNCGGSILDETHILTAAHCVYKGIATLFQVQYGVLDITSNHNIIGVKNFVIHPMYIHAGSFPNDVAVLTLLEPIKFSHVARPINIPEQDAPTPGNQDAVLAGWGHAYDGGTVMEHLQRVDIICYTDEDCDDAYPGVSYHMYHVCAGVPEGGKGQCNGDSGGPLSVDGIQYGVVSWSSKPCTLQGYPGVFARVSSYTDWILEQTVE